MLADMIAEIDVRNQLRREAGLPLLSVTAELRRSKTHQRQEEFEAFFEKERPKYNHLWSGRNLGWAGGFALWTKVRQQVRADFDARRNLPREE